MLGVDADHPHDTFALDDLAFITNFLYTCSNFHLAVTPDSGLAGRLPCSEASLRTAGVLNATKKRWAHSIALRTGLNSSKDAQPNAVMREEGLYQRPRRACNLGHGKRLT